MFRDISDSARFSNDNPEDFYKYQIQAVGEERRQGFRQFCDSLALDPEQKAHRARAFDYLRRTYLILYPDDHNTWEMLLTDAGYLLTGEPETVVATLLTYAENNATFRKPISSDELRRHLATLGIHPKHLAYDQHISPAIEEMQRQFDESIRPGLVGGELILREETTLLIEALEEKKDVILHGTAGYGKSTVLYELAQHLREKDIPYLPIRLDRRDPRNTALQFGRDMDLPDSPVYSLAGIAGERQCVLILDQLDAIRWTCAHSANALDVCKELVRHVQSLRHVGKKIAAVLCCRTFDLEHDPEIRNWLADLPGRNFHKVEVKGLTMKNLEEVVGPSLSQMSDRHKRILACPQNLVMWMELKVTGTIPEFRSAPELMRRFWKKRRLLLEQAGITTEQMGIVLNALIEHMERHAKISAPERIVNDWPNVTRALFSHGILQESTGQITFCHQSYLDYLIADRLIRQINEGTGSVIDWLGLKDRQSLFRREQLRQVLAMLCEESPGDFLGSVKQLLKSDNVRFHLKHLVLELIGQLEEITEELGSYCLELLNNGYWKRHMLETVCMGHAPYVSMLIEKEIIPDWLNSDAEENINQALWLLRSVAEKSPDTIAELLEPFVGRDSGWAARILNTLCWNPIDDSNRMFQLRLQMARLGIVSNFVEWKSLCSKHPLRALQLIEAVVSTWDANLDEDGRNEEPSTGEHRRLENWYDEDLKALNNIAENYPIITWDTFMPHIERLTAFKTRPYDPRMEKWQKDRPRHKTHMEIERGIVELVIISGRKLASEQKEELLKRSIPIERSVSSITQEILINVYANLPATHADIGIRWLLADVTRLPLGGGLDEPEWMPAVRLIKALSPCCSEELFRNLEEAIVYYHSPDEKRLARHYLKGWQNGYFGDYWGRAQYFLLPALDSKRVRPTTLSLIALLSRKYASYPEERFLRGGRISGGWIGSKLDASLEKISDRAWLDIVRNRNISEQRVHNKWIQVDQDHAVTSSVGQFSRSLGNMAKRFPERFGQLSLRFPENVHPLYVAAIIEALGQKDPKSDIPEKEKAEWHPASVKTVEEVLERFRVEDDREAAISLCRLIRGRAEENWSNNAIKRLIYYAMYHPDLEPGKLNVYCDKTADEASVDILFQNTINCVRGVAAEAIGQLLWNHTNLLEELRTGIESLICDPHPAVRMASIEALLPVFNIDKDLAVAWFCKACADDLRVAASPRAVLFFNYSFSSHFDQIAPLIHGMVCSPLDEVSEEGSKEVTARWLFHGMFRKELAECQKGTIPQRKGIAQIASHFLIDKKYTLRCEELLFPLFDDPEKDVRTETSNMFRKNALTNESVNEDFLKSYIRSKAFHDHPSQLVYSLKDLSGSLLSFAEVIFVLCDVFCTTLQEKSREMGSNISHTVSEVSSLLLRLYEQSQNSERFEITNRCLDIWDMLFENRVGMIRELTRAIEK